VSARHRGDELNISPCFCGGKIPEGLKIAGSYGFHVMRVISGLDLELTSKCAARFEDTLKRVNRWLIA
jgi:hypothetical protein